MKSTSAFVIACTLLCAQPIAQSSAASKRGIAYIKGGESADYNLLLTQRSPMDWYYTWTPRTAPGDIFWGSKVDNDTIEFVPTIHNNTKLDDDIKALKDAPSDSKYLFVFNEPDGTFETGGCDLTPQDAARDYIAKIVPLRSRWKISHPVTTGSPRGFQWLQDFNAACWAVDPKNGCPTDFVTVHWYGDFIGMTSWIGQLAAWYNGSNTGLQGDLKVWVTEIGAPSAPMDVNYNVMSQTLPYLDSLGFVDRYAWFGAWRIGGANRNEWTGDGLSLFDGDGGLTTLGALWVGGETNGFIVGEKGVAYSAPTSSNNGSGSGSSSSSTNDTTSGGGADNSTDSGNNNSTGNGTDSGQGSTGNRSEAHSVTTLTWIVWVGLMVTGFWTL